MSERRNGVAKRKGELVGDSADVMLSVLITRVKSFSPACSLLLIRPCLLTGYNMLRDGSKIVCRNTYIDYNIKKNVF